MSNHARQVSEWRSTFLVPESSRLDLGARDTRDARARMIGKTEAHALLAAAVDRLAVLQDRLYADRRWSFLVILQAMDAGGKDGTIKHVFSGVNPQGVCVVSFKAPGPEDLAHDFLWRVHRVLPARGIIGVFNRSHYEEVVVARVHPGLLAPQRLPEVVSDRPHFWENRLGDIRAFESYLARQGTRIVKIFLHVGDAEQKARLRARLEDPDKLWKFDPGDLAERARRTDYMAAYETAITATSTREAPWHVVPADQKWFARLVVADILVSSLEALDLRTPEPDQATLDRLAEARRDLA